MEIVEGKLEPTPEPVSVEIPEGFCPTSTVMSDEVPCVTVVP